MGIIIEKINEEDRPYEKCLRYGAGALSDAELLAVILKTGTKGESALDLAMRVMSQSVRRHGLLGIIDMSVTELRKIKGIGKVKAIQLKCVAELAMRIHTAEREDTVKFDSPEKIADYYMGMLRYETKERLVLIMMDIRGGFIHDSVISIGTVEASLISPREIFIEALKYEAVRIALIHNHPSGDPTPSSEDIEVTRTIAQLGGILGIPLIDHVIIGDNRYISLKERGVIR